ncbi:MAG: 2-C-methyl-D-erythritol 4-phosphate cytidylyltransferase [Chloroflexi bacterium]|nr:2-C-methyl-D-erythritol 4-phosphate cytidylyltransferase [Chloroflexota bacterium]
MGGVDKLFAQVGQRPLLFYSLSAFQDSPLVETIVLVLSAANLDRGRALVAEYSFDKVAQVCLGGQRRQDSVRLGLIHLADCAWVVVHDGARPCVTQGLIARGLEAAQQTGAALAAVPARDTMKLVAPDGTVERTPPRDRLWAAQTPQVFRYSLLLRAHSVAQEAATDDAELVERLGHPVRVYAGDSANIKVTTPEDLAMAAALVPLVAQR